MPKGVFPRRKYEKPPRCKSGFKGVLYFPRCKSKPWKAYIRRHGMYLCIGYFATKVEAAAAYNRKAKEFFGERAWLNPV